MTNQEFFISCWERDSAVTAKSFRSLPNDLVKLTKRHETKFRSSWEIVNHVGPHAKELVQALSEGRMDLVNEGKFDINGPTIYKNTEDAAKDVETYSAKLLDLVKKCDDSTWTDKKIPMYWGEMKIAEMSPMQLCWMMYTDSIYHRGQLSTYYRVIGVAQPNLMGPTAEEEEAMMAKSN